MWWSSCCVIFFDPSTSADIAHYTHRFPIKPLLRLELHNPSCGYVAIKKSLTSSTLPLQASDVRLYCLDDNCLSSTALKNCIYHQGRGGYMRAVDLWEATNWIRCKCTEVGTVSRHRIDGSVTLSSFVEFIPILLTGETRHKLSTGLVQANYCCCAIRLTQNSD